MTWILVLFVLIFSGCQQKTVERQYTEIVTEQPQIDMSSMPMPSNDALGSMQKFTWGLPKNWEEEAGKGFRLASFHLGTDAKAIDASIVNLAGVAGGLEGNLRRWMGQIGMETSNEDLTRLIANASSFKIKSGEIGKLFDFTTVQEKGKSTDKSMMVVMVELKDSTLFIKMTGTIATVDKNKENFLKLAGSIEPAVSENVEEAAPEKIIDPHAGMNMGSDPHSGMDMSAMDANMAVVDQTVLNWSIPKSWKQVGGHPMRLGTFRSVNDPEAFECSVIILGGEAGGLDSNLARWIGQVGLPLTQQNRQALVSKAHSTKTKGGLDVIVYDLTVLQNGNMGEKSMMVGVFAIEGSSVFVKITGTVAEINKERDNFMSFVKSLSRK